MKKLFIKIKAKRYDKAIERAESLVDFCSDSELKTLEYVFPELKESEEERVRKRIINEMHNLYDLEGKVPYSYKQEIHSMINTLQGILSSIRMKGSIV